MSKKNITIISLMLVILTFCQQTRGALIVLTWEGGSGSWSNASLWDPDGVPNNGGGNTYVVFIDGAKTGTNSVVTLDMSALIDSFTIDIGDELFFNNGRLLSIAGTSLANSGTVTINGAPWADCYLRIDGTVTLSGGGMIKMTSSDNSWMYDPSGNDGRLINEDNTIEGAGKIGNNSLSLTNRSTINATGAMIIDPSGAGNLINSGVMRASGGGTLTLSGNGGGNFENHEGVTDGTIEAQGDSTVQLRDNAKIVGGLLTTNNTGGVSEGVIKILEGHSATLDGLTNSGNFQVSDNTSAFLVGDIENIGKMTINGAAFADSRLRIDGTVTLTGGGTIEMTSFDHSWMDDPSGNDGRLINEDNTIEGAGKIGNNSLSLTNRSTINATGNMVIDPSWGGGAGNLINSGVMRASGGGTLTLSGNGDGDFQNYEDSTDGTIEAQGDSTVELTSGAYVTGGLLTTNNNGGAEEGAIRIASGNSATLKDLTNSGNFQVNNNANAYLIGDIENTGKMTIQGAAFADSRLRIDNTVTLTGGGTIEMTSADNSHIDDPSGNNGRLINEDNTIEGAGKIGNNTLSLTNRNTINATGNMVIDPSWGGGAGNLINSGVMRASGGGTLTLSGNGGGDFQNYEGSTSGTIEAQGDSTVQLQNNATIIGGVLTTNGTGGVSEGVIKVVGGYSATLNGLTSSGNFQVSDNARAYLVGDIENSGTITINGVPFANSILFIDGTTALTGDGNIKITSSEQGFIYDPSGSDGRLINEDNTIEGAGNIGYNTLSLTNRSIINSNSNGGTLTVDPSGTGNVINSGVMRASGGGTLKLSGNGGGGFQNYEGSTDGTIEAQGDSTVQLQNNATIVGGLLTTNDTGGVSEGVIKVVGGHSATLNGLTNSGNFQVNDNASAYLVGDIENSGTITVNGAPWNNSCLFIDGTTALTGGGTIKMAGSEQCFIYDPSGNDGRLINEDNTIEGTGSIGHNTLSLTNRGTINADQGSSIVIDPPDSGGVLNDIGGILRGSGTAGLSLNAGKFNNLGTVEALNGSNVTYSSSATCENNVSGVLTNGTWRAVSNGAGATVTIRGSNITKIEENTEVELSGPGSVLQVGSTHLENTLQTNSGTLRILGNRDYTNVNNLANAATGKVELGGGTFDAPVLDNAGEIFGFGTLSPRPTNTGLIRAIGGTLNISGGIQGGSGTVQIDEGASLDISSAGTDSSADYLIHNGSGLNLGDNDFLVGVDYTNANWGSGNSFNHRTNVSGSGQILADPAVTQTLGGDVSDGNTAIATMDFGNVHVGSSKTLNYRINNSGASGPNLRGAIQTSVNGGNITDARLTGLGVTAGNFGPIAVGSDSGDLPVMFNATSAGELTGQAVHIDNNFDNMASQILEFTGAAYRYANPTAHIPEPVDFGIIHVGDVVEQSLSITNNVPSDGFSESLNASTGTTTGDALASGSFNLLLPGQTDNTSLITSLGTSTAGIKSGTVTVNFESDGTGSSGLGITSLPPQVVNVMGQVNSYADPNVQFLSGDGTLTQDTPTSYVLDLGIGTILEAELGILNDEVFPADSLAGSFVLDAVGFTLSGFEPFENIGPGQTHAGLVVGLTGGAPGIFNGLITFSPLSENAGGFSGPLPDISISLKGELVPEPATVCILGLGGLVLLRYRRT